MEGPALDLTQISIPSAVGRFKEHLLEPTAMENQDGLPSSERDQPIPSSHELALLKQELTRMKEYALDKQIVIKENQKLLGEWIAKHDPTGQIQRESIETKQRKIKLKLKDSKSEVEDLESNLKFLKRKSSSDEDRKDPNNTVKYKTGENGIKLSISGAGVIRIGTTANTPTATKALDNLPFPTKKKSKIAHHRRDSRVKKRSGEVSSARSTPDLDNSMGPAIGDYSKQKAQQNQIPIATFWSYMEQYFRNLVVEDLQALESNGDEVTPFMIPEIGQHYKLQWKEEDKKILNLLDEGVTNPGLAMNKEYFEFEDTVYEGEMGLGSLSEKILGAFVREGTVPTGFEEDEEVQNSITNKFVVKSRSKHDLYVFEERLKAELTHLGLLPKLDNDETNEITEHLLTAQNELREQLAINFERKKKLLKIARDYMAHQEYNTLLDEINKSVENAYIKRFKSNLKKPKKKPGKESKEAKEMKELIQLPPPSTDSFMQTLANRKKLIAEVGDVYFPDAKFQLPTESIYSEINDS